MTFTDEFTFTSMQVVSIFDMMLRFVGSLINTHDDDDDDEDWSTSTKDLPCTSTWSRAEPLQTNGTGSLTTKCSSCLPTNSVTALKEKHI